MPISVLVVDDSAVTRGLISQALAADPAISVCGLAENGAAAVSMAQAAKPEVIILDIEMPVMDGLTALPELRRVSPDSRIIVASTLTMRNAEISMRALSLGAVDYLPKPSAKDSAAFFQDLIAKVKALGQAQPLTAMLQAESKKDPALLRTASADTPLKDIKALAIIASTGGPHALISLFSQIRGCLHDLPIFITQHMPPTFTTILAEHIGKEGARPCAEAYDQQTVIPGCVYVAPGDYHMVPQKHGEDVVIRINQDPPEHFCRPSANPMLRALANIYGKHLAVVVLTGMGQDGLEGAREVVKRGGCVIAQNEATCVVFGMPKAVADQRLCRAVLPLQDIGSYLIQQIESKPKLDAFQFLASLLKQRSGLSLTEDKMYLIESRLLPIARSYGFADVPALCAELRIKPDEELLTEVTEAMTTNESSFFRDIKPYEHLRHLLLPALMEKRAEQKQLRIWSAACAIGQEPYSVAMCLKEEDQAINGWKVEIVATDIAGKVIDRAKAGLYSQFEAQRGLPIHMLVKYFSQMPDTSWRIKDELKTMVQFKKQNLLNDFGTLGSFDIILCRNVLIYFDEPTKAQVTARLANALRPDGILILGATESLHDVGKRFKSFPGVHGAFQLAQ